MVFFDKKYSLHEFLEKVPKHVPVSVIGVKSIEERAGNVYIVDGLKDKGITASVSLLDYNIERDIFSYNGIEYNIKTQLFQFLKEKVKETSIIILNITSMNIRLLGAILHCLKQLDNIRVCCQYTEPERYRKTIPDVEKNFSSMFKLYSNYRGIDAIPGFLRANDNGDEEEWVVFLGFDGNRAKEIYDQYEFTSITPIVTLPGFKPGWHNYAIKSNMDFLSGLNTSLQYIAANSIAAVYNYLSVKQSNNKNHYFRVTPLGTKVNALGVLLYCLNNKDQIEVLYDNPYENGESCEGVGRIHVFDVTEILYYVDM